MSLKINAQPSKRFFIDMITRDIGLSDSIMDMIDNSIDSLIKLHSIEIFDTFKDGLKDEIKEAVDYAEINIEFDNESFLISDNCGGITIEEAKNKVFLFGAPEKKETKENDKNTYTGLSVYGIGMKRAFFKLGKFIEFESRHKNESFKMSIDVDKWEQEEEWDFTFNEIKDDDTTREIQDRITVIKISNLKESASNRFSISSFENELIEKIESAYALFLDLGIKIIVNGTQAEVELPELSHSEKIAPIKKSYVYNIEDGEDVEILIIAGITPRSDSKPRGWYVFCNGRMILEANKDQRTGWGESYPQFHTKYNHFVGFVYFRSTNVEALPWTTTKESIELDNDVYKYALDNMKADTRQITNFLNRLYQDVEEVEGEEKEAFEEVKGISIKDIKNNESEFSKVKRTKNPMTTISYKKRQSEVDDIKTCAGNPAMSNKELGLLTFEYYQSLECN